MDACTGTEQCSDGYTEKTKGKDMCNQCITKAPYGQPTYYRAPNQKCVQCNGTLQTVLFIIIFAVVLLIAGRLMMWVAKKGKNFGSVRILIDYFQILFIFGSFKLQWPQAAVAHMQFFSIAMFNIEMATPSCLAPDFGYLQIFIMMMITPIIFIGGLALYSVVSTPPLNRPIVFCQNIVRGFQKRELITYEKEWNIEAYKKSTRQAITASNLFLQFAFASLVGWSLGFFNCQLAPNGQYVSYKDPSLVCGQGQHLALSGLAIFGIIVYMGGIPLWLCGLFYFQRQKRFNSPFFVYAKDLAATILKSENCSFNYQHHPFVVVQMLTKSIMIFAQMYFKTFNVVQGLFVQLAILFYTGFLLYMKPYKNSSDNIVDMAAQVSSVVTLSAGILFYNAKSDGIRGLDALGGIVIAIIWCSIIGICIVIGFDIRNRRMESKNKQLEGGDKKAEGGEAGKKKKKGKTFSAFGGDDDEGGDDNAGEEDKEAAKEEEEKGKKVKETKKKEDKTKKQTKKESNKKETSKVAEIEVQKSSTLDKQETKETRHTERNNTGR